MHSYASPTPQTCFPPLLPSTWLACLSFECILQTQAPTARSESISSTYIQQHRKAPYGICNTTSQLQQQCCFLAVCSYQTVLNPIVFCFNCAPSGCWLVTQHARLAHLGEVQLYDLTTRAGLHTQMHARIPTKSVYWCLEEQQRSPVEPITRTALISLEREREARLKDGGDWR